MTGRSFTLAVSPDDTLDEVSQKIKMKEGINPDQQVFLFNGITLQMDDTIDDYYIQEYATLFLRLRNIGG